MKGNVLLTRPEGENEELAARLEATGLTVQIRPLIDLLEGDLSAAGKQVVMNLDQYDDIVFVSKSAVRFGLPLLDAYWPQWPVGLSWLAVGQGTAELLEGWRLRPVFPAEAGSEGLLALPELKQVEGHQILIVRGGGGRELLSDSLRERGATVTYWEVYVRQPRFWPDWSGIEAGTTAVATSREILEQLVIQLSGRVQDIHLVVASDRIAETAANSGFASIKIAAGASEQALYESVTASVKAQE